MNSLSWLIYFGDVVGQFRVLLLILLIMSLFFAGCATLSLAITEGETFGWYKRVFLRMVMAPVLFAVAWIVIPSKQTLYMIAASEVGQMVYEKPTAQEFLGDVKDILGAELKRLKSEATK